MTVEEVMSRLEAMGDPTRRAFNAKRGVGEQQFGVKNGDLRKLAKEIKTNPALAEQLWETGVVDAQMLAVLLIKPRSVDADRLDAMVRSLTYTWTADWLNNYIVKKHPAREALREQWMQTDDAWAARSGWSLTATRVSKEPDGLDLDALLDRIETEMADADPRVQWTMNTTLVEIGIHHPEHRERALAIGEALGIYRDYPTATGCTSPFAPVWIGEMVSRQE